MASIRSCSLTRRALKSRYRDLACIAYVQRRRPMHWSMRQISPKFRNGSVTQTLPLRGFMIGVKVVRKIPQHFGSPIRQKVRRWFSYIFVPLAGSVDASRSWIMGNKGDQAADVGTDHPGQPDHGTLQGLTHNHIQS